MAITTNTFTINAGFARSDVITQLESAFTWLGWHGGTHTGIVTGISAYSGGGDINAAVSYVDVRQSSTSGVGTDASFYVTRNSGGTVSSIWVNRPGYGYTDGEVVQLSAEDIGGASNGAAGIALTVFVAGGASPVGYGSTNVFYDKALTSGASTYPWGVLRHTIQPNKKYGDTYRSFQVTAGGSAAAFTLNFAVGNAFHPWDTDNTSDRGLYYGNRWAGAATLDLPGNQITSTQNQLSTSTISTKATQLGGVTITSTGGSSYQLDLNVYRSGIDPNFVVFSYKQPTLSSTHLTTNTDATFFFSNFTTNIWDLNYVFLSGVTLISPNEGNAAAPQLNFSTKNGGNEDDQGNYYMCVRAAESGYHRAGSSNGYNADANRDYLETIYASNAYPHNKSDDSRIYYRNNSQDEVKIESAADFNAVIKGIPLSAKMLPCPYYLPDDFVLIDFDYATPSANIQQGDTITISGSEVYTVITGSYNQTTRTRGILFCARTV